MRIAIGRIDGSLYGRLVLHDVSVKDPKGEFLYLPRAETEWRPRSYFDNRLDIRSAEAERMFLRRLPEFRETDSDAPLLPEFDISIGSLEIGRVIIEKPVTGERRIATLVGNADITDGRAIIGLGARTLAVEGGRP
jgi:translocation and assembly module TamB